MENLMSTHLPHLDVGSGRQRGALTLFPVWIDAPSIHGIEWRTTGLEVGELPAGPSVGQLLVGNREPRPTLLLEGDLLDGGMQHRMAASSTLLPAHEAMPVDVLCVEAGRWSGERAHRSTGRRASYAVRQGNLAGGGRDQDEVWTRVRRYDAAFEASPTSSMLDHLDRVDDEPVRRMSGQRGVIVGIGGRVIGMELFGSSRGLAARWDGLVRAAQLDARLAPVHATPAQAARDFVRALGRTTLEDRERSGLATAVHSTHGPLMASGARGTSLPGAPLLHLTAFDATHPLLVAA
jgi:hypothetical protein